MTDTAGTIIAACLAHGGPRRHSPLHGEEHWMRVALAGARLIAAHPEEGIDAELVLLFALLHDARRENEDWDPQHGPRAAALARQLNAEVLHLEPPRLERLAATIHDHNGCGPSDEATRGTCLDADRLNLWRVGIIPDPALLSRPWARTEAGITHGRDLIDGPADWGLVARTYAPLLAAAPAQAG